MVPHRWYCAVDSWTGNRGYPSVECHERTVDRNERQFHANRQVDREDPYGGKQRVRDRLVRNIPIAIQ